MSSCWTRQQISTHTTEHTSRLRRYTIKRYIIKLNIFSLCATSNMLITPSTCYLDRTCIECLSYLFLSQSFPKVHQCFFFFFPKDYDMTKVLCTSLDFRGGESNVPKCSIWILCRWLLTRLVAEFLSAWKFNTILKHVHNGYLFWKRTNGWSTFPHIIFLVYPFLLPLFHKVKPLGGSFRNILKSSF